MQVGRGLSKGGGRGCVSKAVGVGTCRLWSGKGKSSGSWSPGHRQRSGDLWAATSQRGQWRPDTPGTLCGHLPPGNLTHLYS